MKKTKYRRDTEEHNNEGIGAGKGEQEGEEEGGEG